MLQKEAKARIKINKLLEESGWRLIADSTGRANVEQYEYSLPDNRETIKKKNSNFVNVIIKMPRIEGRGDLNVFTTE